MNKDQWLKQYKRPEWQKKRLEIMNRDMWKCTHCETTEEMLSVHHKWYEMGKKVWDYPNECFETLCSDCHGYSHELTNSILRNVKRSFFGSGWTMYDLDMFFALVEENDEYSHKLLCSIQEISVKRSEELSGKRKNEH